jgi:hypothetical protein
VIRADLLKAVIGAYVHATGKCETAINNQKLSMIAQIDKGALVEWQIRVN